jgi:SAM-dependent methyltransferase
MTAASEPYDPRNLLDRLSSVERLERHYRYVEHRERRLVDAALGINGGRVLSIGSGWHPGRHLFPAPQFELVAVDPVYERVELALYRKTADEGHVGRAGELDLPPESFDVILYREVLHHVVFQQALDRPLAEAYTLLRPGGAIVVIEPNLWHPVGAALALANRLRLGTRLHGTPDDVPLSPRRLMRSLRAAGFQPAIAPVTYTWRRLPPSPHDAVARLDRRAPNRVTARLGHTFLICGRKPGRPTRRLAERRHVQHPSPDAPWNAKTTASA